MASGESSRSEANVRRIKRLGYYANYALTGIIVILLLVGIIVWIWEEYAKSEIHLARIFLPDPKLREARVILFIGYILTLAFLSMIQCCIQIAKDPHHQHIGPRRMVWCLASSLMILVFVAAAALAASYGSNTLSRLKETMHTNLTNGSYYSNFTAKQYSHSGLTFNEVQSTVQCCGVEGRDDFSTQFKNQYNMSVPYSCCKLKSGVGAGPNINMDDVEDLSACQNNSDSEYSFTRGCHDILYSSTKSMCKEITIIGVVAAVVIFVVAALRLILGHVYQRSKKKQEYNSVTTVNIKERKDEENAASGSGEQNDTQF